MQRQTGRVEPLPPFPRSARPWPHISRVSYLCPGMAWPACRAGEKGSATKSPSPTAAVTEAQRLLKASQKGTAPTNRCTHTPRWPDPTAARRVETKRIGGRNVLETKLGLLFLDGGRPTDGRCLSCRGAARVLSLWGHQHNQLQLRRRPRLRPPKLHAFPFRFVSGNGFLGMEKGAWPWFSAQE